MTTYAFDDSELAQLRGKTVLIIGAASGIGYETVKLAHSMKNLASTLLCMDHYAYPFCLGNGANVAIGDWNEAQGQALATELKE